MVTQLHRQQPRNTSSSNSAQAQEHRSSTAKGDITTGRWGGRIARARTTLFVALIIIVITVVVVGCLKSKLSNAPCSLDILFCFSSSQMHRIFSNLPSGIIDHHIHLDYFFFTDFENGPFTPFCNYDFNAYTVV